MIKIKSKDPHHSFSSKFIENIENHIKYGFKVDFLNPANSLVDKIKALLKTKYDAQKTNEFLKRLDVFTDITEISNIFYAKEKKTNISIKSKLNEQNTLETVANLCMPNVYGSGESINFSCLPLKGFHLLFRKPLVTEKTLSFIELKVFEEIKKINDKKYTSRGICVSQINDNLSVGLRNDIFNDKPVYSSYLNYHAKKYNVSINSGITSLSPFLKLSGGFNNKFVWNRFYLKASFQCGLIKGKSHPTNRFSLGGNTIGYKENTITVPNGGKSFFEINNEVGVKFGNLNLFVRKNLAFNSNKNQVCDIFADMKKSIPKLKENVGLGFGVGLSYLYNGINVGVAYSMPLKGENKYVLIFDAEM